MKRIMVDSISYDIPDYDYPLVILLAGVNGVGKTTAIGKLANYFKSIGKSVVVAAADTFRAAASDQLEVWADRANVRIIKHKEGSDPASVVFDAISSAKARGDDVILVDTAGRLHNKKNLMDELKKSTRSSSGNCRTPIIAAISCLTRRRDKTHCRKSRFSRKQSTSTA